MYCLKKKEKKKSLFIIIFPKEFEYVYLKSPIIENRRELSRMIISKVHIFQEFFPWKLITKCALKNNAKKIRESHLQNLIIPFLSTKKIEEEISTFPSIRKREKSLNMKRGVLHAKDFLNNTRETLEPRKRFLSSILMLCKDTSIQQKQYQMDFKKVFKKAWSYKHYFWVNQEKTFQQHILHVSQIATEFTRL